MFFGNIAELEVTKEKSLANSLLNDGWILLDIRGTVDHNGVREPDDCGFVFILGRADHHRRTIMDGLRDVVSTARKAV